MTYADMKIHSICLVLEILVFMALSKPLFGQNLIANGGFEEYTASENPLSARHISQLNSWHNISWQVFYCNSEITDQRPWQVSFCDFQNNSPHSGSAMVKVVYQAAGTTEQTNCTRGCTGYLQANLTAPLQIGEVYEVSMWVLYPLVRMNSRAEIGVRSHIGFALGLSEIGMSSNNMLDMDYFFASNVDFDQWVQIKYYIRALCPLKTMTIGLFRNRTFPLIDRPNADVERPFFFIDDVSVAKVSADQLGVDIKPTPFCRFFEEESDRLAVSTDQSLLLNFDTDDFKLDQSNINKLDSFIAIVDHRWNPVYKIFGYTDDTGNENDLLSRNRAYEVRDYLADSLFIQRFRMICFGKGSSDPISKENSDSGRSLNRRVEIKVSSLSHSTGLYRMVLNSVEDGDVPQAFNWLRRWSNSLRGRSPLLILFDPRLNELKGYQNWQNLYSIIKGYYHKYPAENYSFFLDSMYCEDQRYRTLEPMLYGLTGFIDNSDTFYIRGLRESNDAMEKHDSTNTIALFDYLDKHGFPSITDVGRRQVKGVIYHLIHMGDTSALIHYLPIIKSRCLKGEAEWQYYAMAHDRYLRLAGRKQEYGTQYELIGNSKTIMMLAPIDDLIAVNDRRIRIGMSSLTEESLSEEIRVRYENLHRTE
jgi:outer membrane protein OmpA-like peptidoglycan-associated protein